MELRQLRYFCAVAEDLSFARAARRLFTAQPALSVQIRHLEEELKVRLFERTTRSVKLTHAGSTFYAEAVKILAGVETAAQHARDADKGVIGTLRVAVVSNVATADLGSRMASYRDRFPRVNLTVLEASANRQAEMLLRREIDLGVFRISRARERKRTAVSLDADVGLDRRAAGVGLPGDELVLKEISREPMIVAVPAGGALARKRRLSWRDFHGCPLILTTDARERYFEPFLACCERERVEPVVSQYANELMTRLWLVACGFGFTPTSASSQEITRPGLAYRPLPGDAPEVLVIAAWRRADREPHLLHFIETL